MRGLSLALASALLLSEAVVGLRSGFVVEWQPIDLLLQWFQVFSLGLLCVVDARARRQRLPLSTQWYFALVPVIAVPAYAFWSRGVRSILVLLALVLGWRIAGVCGWTIGTWIGA